MKALALLVQEGLGLAPVAGDALVFRGRGGSLTNAPLQDGIGLSLYAKRLDRGRFVWPTTVDAVVALSAAHLLARSDPLEKSATHSTAAERRIKE